MKTRDSKGRFSKLNSDGGLVLTIPNLNTILYWLSLLFIFYPGSLYYQSLILWKKSLEYSIRYSKKLRVLKQTKKMVYFTK